MPNRSPYTPTEEHPISSPIWDCSITAIEVFFLEESGETNSVHACIERMSSTRTSADIPGTAEGGTAYTAEDIKRMIDNDPGSSKGGRAFRGSTRRRVSYCAPRVDVCSVRVRYNNIHMFLDRDVVERNHWSNASLHLSTEQIKSILSFEGFWWVEHLSAQVS
jgi:hypothetical protein